MSHAITFRSGVAATGPSHARPRRVDSGASRQFPGRAVAGSRGTPRKRRPTPISPPGSSGARRSSSRSSSTATSSVSSGSSRATSATRRRRTRTQEVFLKLYSALDSSTSRYRFDVGVPDRRERRDRTFAAAEDPRHPAGAPRGRRVGPPVDRSCRRQSRPARGASPGCVSGKPSTSRRSLPGRLPGADQPPPSRGAGLRRDRRAEGMPRDGQEQALPCPPGPARSLPKGTV